MFEIAAVEGLFITWDFVLLIGVATILAFIAHKTFQPNLVAYLVAGIILGPAFLGLVSKGNLVSVISELGLAMLLFLLGLELKFESIKKILKSILRIGFLQITLHAALSSLLAYLLGFEQMEIIVITLATIYASTAVVVKILTDKNEARMLPGKIDIGVLLVQDIFVVIVLTILSAPDLSSPVPIAINFAKVMGVMGILAGVSYSISRWLIPEMIKEIGEDKHILFINGAAWAFLFISVSLYLGVPVEIGAFIAGLGIAQTPYSIELKEQMRPLTNFFMVLFFTSIGLQLTSGNLLMYWKEALVSSIVFMVGGFSIMFILINREKFSIETIFKGSINMTQLSEFALIVGTIGLNRGLIGEGILGYLSLTALITMASSTYLIKHNHELYERVKHLFEFLDSEEKKDVEFKVLKDHAVIIGYDEIARRLIPVLKEEFGDVLVVDSNPGYTDELSKSQAEFLFGDFKHGEMRKYASIQNAKIVISFALDDAVNRRVLEEVSKETITFLRAKKREEAAELYDLGADFVIIKDILSAEKLAEYIEAFLDDPKSFEEETDGDKEMIYWEARK